MSNLERDPAEFAGGGQPPLEAVTELLEPRKVWLGKTTQVRRLLPHKERRMVGAWCFVDHYGPDDIAASPGMRVPPHPHCGLQTVSWLLAGEVQHLDSVGSAVRIGPGELHIMTAGAGIAHSEESPPDHPPLLHGVQLWVALPDAHRHTAPRAFDSYRELPVADLGDGVSATVMVGALAGVRSPAPTYSPLVGAEIALPTGASARVPLAAEHEHAVLVTEGSATVEDTRLQHGEMLYLGIGRTAVSVASTGAARLLLLGGEPFEEQIVMWWNFIGRSHDEIVEARADWMAESDRFGVVEEFDGDRLPAPEMPNSRLRPRGRTR
ncbi:MAG: pirin family protein [Nocardioidaceae bacterium]